MLSQSLKWPAQSKDNLFQNTEIITGLHASIYSYVDTLCSNAGVISYKTG